MLCREPYLLRHDEIMRLTPRQIFDHYLRRDEEGERADAPSPRGPASNLDGAQGVTGLGLGQYECWKPIEGEKENPDNVPLSIVIARYYAMGFELCRKGQLGGVRRGDFEAGKEFLDSQWQEWEVKNKVNRAETRVHLERETILWRQRSGAE
jgi:hypothetical protein